jgi:putative endonuclease
MASTQRRSAYRKGLRAEILACWWLRLQGYRILAQRYKTPVGEIDVIARRAGRVVFIEVKARHGHADALDAATQSQPRVVRAAQYALVGMPNLAGLQFRFDVISVPWYMLPKHHKSAYSAPDAWL